ncbi:hypothetical protein TNCV_2461401 [Trichonephila clavipes]|nr:hypothetical protein TNCV_2461401 [Trichonephila clavipes]
MKLFTNAESADMCLISRLAEGNAGAAERLYRERYPQRHAPDCRIFSYLRQNLYKYGSLQGNWLSEGGPRVTRTSSWNREPKSELSLLLWEDFGVVVHHVLQHESLFPYYLQRVHHSICSIFYQ